MTRRQLLLSLAGVGVVISSLVATGWIGGYRLNLTPSEPLGLWRIEALYSDVAVGDLVFICPPPTPQFEEAWHRGYLRRGLCASGFAPLIKTVAALPGQHVAIGETIEVDGVPLGASRLRKSDGQRRAIVPYSGGVVPRGYLFFHSSFESSYDSRYFGPIPDSGLLGLAKPILTFDP